MKALLGTVLLAGGLSLSVMLSACGLACTEMGCWGGALFTFERGFDEGRNRIAIDADGEKITCDWDSTTEAFGDRFRCSYDEEGGYYAEPAIVDEEEGTLRVLPIAKRVRIEIFHEDESVFAQSFEPKYEKDYPNGEACDGPDGACRFASITVPADG